MRDSNIQRYSTPSNARRALAKIGEHARAAHATLIKHDPELDTCYFVTEEANKVQRKGAQNAKMNADLRSAGSVQPASKAQKAVKSEAAAPQALANPNAHVCIDNLAKMAPVAVQPASNSESKAPAAPKAAKPAKATKAKAEVRNGVRKPMKGVCANVWAILDEFTEGTGRQPVIADVRLLAEAHNWNVNNATIEFYAWRKFHAMPKA